MGDDILKDLEPGRRDFLKRILAGTAFTVPLMASFSMEGLSANAAEAAACPYPYPPCSETPYDGPIEFKIQMFRASGANEGKKHGSLRIKVLEDGCALHYHFTKLDTLLHTTFQQVAAGAGILATSTGQFEGVLNRALGSLRARVEQGSGQFASALSHHRLFSTLNGIGSGFSFPVCFLLSPAGLLQLHHEGLVCAGPGFDVRLLLEALAAGEFFIFYLDEKGMVAGGVM